MPAWTAGHQPPGIYGSLRSAVLRPDATSWPLLVAPVAMSIGAGPLALLIFKLPLIKVGENRVCCASLRDERRLLERAKIGRGISAPATAHFRRPLRQAFCFINVVREKARSDWLRFSQFRTCLPDRVK